MNTLKTANILRNIARYTLLILGILVFVFALLSGAEKYDNGLQGIIQNSPNALPWILLLTVVFIAWKWELTGGILTILLSIGMLIFFVLLGNHFFLIPFILTMVIIILGFFFILSWHLRKKQE
ncbi:MAG: hypothetical protein J7L46_05200 [Bacteroidales bacterium]|nr:hypothetical protein [Bacteroidales bacterium]